MPGDRSAAAAGRRRRALHPKIMRASLLPAAVLLVALVLGLLGISGSSLGVYGTAVGQSEDEAGILAGPARQIRSDEWLVRTPWVERQLERGLPSRIASGVGTHDASVFIDLPTGGWEVILRPHTLVYRLLGAEQAFAFEWWSFFGLQLLGVYVLVLTLTGRVGLSALAGAAVTLSPATQWWTTPVTFTTVGYGCLATAAVLRAYWAPTLRRRLVLSILAGLAFAAFLTTLYPPWQVGVGLVLAPIGIAAVVPDLRTAAGRRRFARSVAVVLPVTAVVAGVLFGAFVSTHRDAIDVITSTVYPGQRVAQKGGGTPVAIVLGAAFDSFSSAESFQMVNGTNQSENSSALPYLLPAGLGVGVLLIRRRLAGSRATAPLVGSLVGAGVVAAWMLLPIPGKLGQFLLLTRVPPTRLHLPLAVGGAIALALLVSHQSDSGKRLGRLEILGVLAVTGAALVWGARRYSVEGAGIDQGRAGVFIIIVVVGLALVLSRRPLPGLVILALFSLWQASLINPVQDGMGALRNSDLRVAIEAVEREGSSDAGWIAYSVDASVKGTLTAAGVNSLSGVSPYPDWDAWRIIDPGLVHQDIWNRYGHVSFAVAAPGALTTFNTQSPDSFEILLDPCSPVVSQLGVSYLVSQNFEVASCTQLLAKVSHGGTDVYIYRHRPQA